MRVRRLLQVGGQHDAQRYARDGQQGAEQHAARRVLAVDAMGHGQGGRCRGGRQHAEQEHLLEQLALQADGYAHSEHHQRLQQILQPQVEDDVAIEARPDARQDQAQGEQGNAAGCPADLVRRRHQQLRQPDTQQRAGEAQQGQQYQGLTQGLFERLARAACRWATTT